METALDGFFSVHPGLSAFRQGTRWLMRKRTFRNGQIVIRAKDRVDGLYFLVGGCLRVSMPNPEGSCVMLSLESPASITGSVEILEGIAAISTVESVGESVCLYLPAEVYASASARDPALPDFVARDLARKLIATSSLSAVKNAPAMARIAWYFLGSGGDGVEVVKKRDMASFLGISERHLNRHLSLLLEEGLIVQNGKEFTVARKSGLEILAEGCTGTGVPVFQGSKSRRGAVRRSGSV